MGVGITAVASYQVVRELMLENLQKDALSKVEHGTHKIDNWLAKLKVKVETMANTPSVRSMQWSIVRPYLMSEAVRIQDFESISLAKSTGQRYSTATPHVTSIRDRQWFQASIAGKTYIDDPIISRATQLSVIGVSAPIYKHATRTEPPIGVLRGAIEVNQVTKTVEQIEYGKGSYAFALNSEGRIIAHPDASLLSTIEKPTPSLLQSSEPDLVNLAQRMVAHQEGIMLVQSNRKKFYVAFMPLTEARWSIGLAIPRENIDSQLNWLDGIAAAVISLTGMLLGILVYVQSAEQAQLKRSKAEAEATNQLLEQKVAERTRELADARDQLEQRVTERTQELQAALQDLTQTQSRLVQTEKMSSLGQLVAGIAHEINNPVNFIHGNVSHVNEYVTDLLSLVALYQQKYPNPDAEIQQAIADIELDFIEADLPKTLASMNIGTHRIREIVQSLRIFSRMDEAELKPVDLHTGIDSTLLILQHRLKARPDRPAIEVVKQYGDLPRVECYAGQLNQVFMNILANAIDALEETSSHSSHQNGDTLGTITITTQYAPKTQTVTVAIADNGPGMPETVKQRIFDPFFTTKPIGKGTGMGLSISYQIIHEKHNGQMECISTPDVGTEFIIHIPVKQPISEVA